MPLLGKEDFSLQNLPPNLDPNLEIFYCSITGEAFLTYDEYFERQILYSSLLWTCSVTGKTGLTYAEALKSEQESQTLLSSVPRVLQKVLLHLMKYMENFNTNVVLSIILEYTNLRYFIGENVQVITNKTKRNSGIVRNVLPPENYESSSSVSYGIDPLKYQYVVEIIEPNKKKSHESGNHKEIVAASRISRPKTMLTREKLRLFLKQHLSAKTSRYDTLSIKEESVHKFGLDHMKWESIFKGPIPNFKDDTTLVRAYNKRNSEITDSTADNKDDTYDEKKGGDPKASLQVVKKRSSMLTDQKLKRIQREEKLKQAAQMQSAAKAKGVKKSKKQKLKEKLKAKKMMKKKGSKKDKAAAEEAAAPAVPTKEDKIEQKKKIKEARRKFEEGTRSWLEKRDDLLCDDLQRLPQPTPVHCDIDINLFGDSLVILEFINVFQDFINDFSNVFEPKVSIEMFAQILNDTDVSDPYSDLLQILLDTILMSHRDDTEEGDLNIHKANEDFGEEDDSYFYNNNYSNFWVASNFGTHENLAKLKLDAFTLNEILRIYLFKVRNSDLKRSRHCDDQEDVALAIKLTSASVFELNQKERIVLFNLLLNDLVKVPQIRQKIEDSMEEISQHKAEIRRVNASFAKWLRDNPIRQRIRKKKQPTDNAENKEQTEAEPVENEATQAEKEQYKREKTKKEQEMKKQISDSKAQIRQLSAYCRPRPLGLDRSFRRYWIFQSVTGLLVEHPIEDVQTRSCFESPIPMRKPQLTDYLPNAKKRKRKSKADETVNAENDPTNATEELIFERCTGHLSTCSVHGAINSERRVLWSFYTKEQLDDLIESLNARGLRENELKNSLNLEKISILRDHLETFEPTILNESYEPPPPPPVMIEQILEDNMDCNLRKSERIQNQIIEKATQAPPKLVETISKHRKTENKYSKLPPTEALGIAFQDKLSSLEDELYQGCLSSLDEAAREDWLRSVDSNDPSDKRKSIERLTKLFRTLATTLRPFCLLPPLSVIPDSSVSSPSDKENIEHIQPKIPKLSEKWLEGIKIADDAFSGQFNDAESSFGFTNLSQLFVNMYILEKSINWELSARKTATKCRICRRKANEELILCDLCNKGYHIYCLKPPIAKISDIEGDWFCYTCAPRSSTSSKKNIPQKVVPQKQELKEVKHSYNEDDDTEFMEEDSYEDSSGDVCRVCKHELFDEYNEVLCKSCNHGYHLNCVKLSRAPRSWCCRPCEAKERYDQDHSDEGADLRRSTRKRKPNHYYDENSIEEGYPSNRKTKRL